MEKGKLLHTLSLTCSFFPLIATLPGMLLPLWPPAVVSVMLLDKTILIVLLGFGRASAKSLKCRRWSRSVVTFNSWHGSRTWPLKTASETKEKMKRTDKEIKFLRRLQRICYTQILMNNEIRPVNIMRYEMSPRRSSSVFIRTFTVNESSEKSDYSGSHTCI